MSSQSDSATTTVLTVAQIDAEIEPYLKLARLYPSEILEKLCPYFATETGKAIMNEIDLDKHFRSPFFYKKLVEHDTVLSDDDKRLLSDKMNSAVHTLLKLRKNPISGILNDYYWSCLNISGIGTHKAVYEFLFRIECNLSDFHIERLFAKYYKVDVPRLTESWSRMHPAVWYMSLPDCHKAILVYNYNNREL